MTQATREPKYPKFVGHLHSKGIDVKTFTSILNNKGHNQYKYHTVLRKLNGESKLDFDDIVIFSEVMEVDETIFFN